MRTFVDPSMLLGTAHWLRVVVTSCALVVVAASTVSADLIGYWTFDEGSVSGADTVLDVSGKNHHGTPINMTAANWVAHGAGYALSFDGALNRYVVLPNTPSLRDVQTNNYTLMAWAKADDGTTSKGIFHKTGNHLGIRMVDDLRATHWFTTQQNVSVSGTNTNWDQWRHVAMVLDKNAGNVFLYVNGILEGSNTFTPGRAVLNYGNSTWKIGAANTTGQWAWPMNGLIDEVAIFDTAESDTMIAAIHGLSVFSGLDVNDAKVAEIVGLSTLGDQVTGVGANDHIWRYVDGLTGVTGTIGGQVGDFSAFIVLDGGNGYGVQLIPEPGAALLLLSALAWGLLLVRRRRAG